MNVYHELKRKKDVEGVSAQKQEEREEKFAQATNESKSKSVTEYDEELTKQITDMGFQDPDQIANALEMAEGNVLNAINMLVESPNRVKEHRRSKTSPPRSLSSNLNSSGASKSKSYLHVDEFNKATKKSNFPQTQSDPFFNSESFSIYSGNLVRSLMNIKLEASLSWFEPPNDPIQASAL